MIEFSHEVDKEKQSWAISLEIKETVWRQYTRRWCNKEIVGPPPFINVIYDFKVIVDQKNDEN